MEYVQSDKLFPKSSPYQKNRRLSVRRFFVISLLRQKSFFVIFAMTEKIHFPKREFVRTKNFFTSELMPKIFRSFFTADPFPHQRSNVHFPRLQFSLLLRKKWRRPGTRFCICRIECIRDDCNFRRDRCSCRRLFCISRSECMYRDPDDSETSIRD